MLTVEQFKDVFNNFDVEGFKIPKRKYMNTHIIVPCGEFVSIKSLIYETVYYPLLLDRVCQAINKSHDNIDAKLYPIIISNNEMIECCYYNDSLDCVFRFEDYESIDQCREKAIIYILDQIGGER